MAVDAVFVGEGYVDIPIAQKLHDTGHVSFQQLDRSIGEILRYALQHGRQKRWRGGCVTPDANGPHRRAAQRAKLFLKLAGLIDEAPDQGHGLPARRRRVDSFGRRADEDIMAQRVFEHIDRRSN